jgi:molybdenum cofactor cytidylyltransferase
MSLAPHSDTSFAVLLLAAGASSRLGRPKQLLDYQGKALLAHSLGVAKASGAQPVITVLGAHADQLKNAIEWGDAEVTINPDWKEGMAASIRHGMELLASRHPEVEGVILMVCDQPKVTEEVLQNLVLAYQTTRKPIIASGYEDTFGPPVFFHRAFFNALMQLKNDTGARNIIRDHPNEVEIVPFPGGNFDIDTEVDYEKLRRSEEL